MLFVVGDANLATWLEQSVLPAGTGVYLAPINLHPSGLVLVVMGQPGVYATDGERHGLAVLDARLVMGLDVRRTDVSELLPGTSETVGSEDTEIMTGRIMTGSVATTGPSTMGPSLPGIDGIDRSDRSLTTLHTAAMNLVFVDGRLLPQEAYHWEVSREAPSPPRLVLHHDHWNDAVEVEVIEIQGVIVDRQTLYHGPGFEVDTETLRSPQAQEPEDEREPAPTLWERLNED